MKMAHESTKQKTLGNIRRNKLHPAYAMSHKTTVLVMNWVPMARHGLILWENEATGSRKVSKYLPCLRDAIFCIQNASPNQTIQVFPYIYILPIYRHGG